MNDFRDPREPVLGSTPVTEAEVRRMQTEAYGSGWALGPLIGLMLLGAVIFFAMSSGENTQVAQNETPPAATTEPATPQVPAPPRAPAGESGSN